MTRKIHSLGEPNHGFLSSVQNHEVTTLHVFRFTIMKDTVIQRLIQYSDEMQQLQKVFTEKSEKDYEQIFSILCRQDR